MVIKRITAANPNLTSGRNITETQHYWARTHGPFVAHAPTLRRYHHYFTTPEAYALEPKPTFIGISMFWRDDHLRMPGDWEKGSEAEAWQTYYANQPGGSDDRQLFDRTERWPTDDQHCDILGEEHVIIDGETRPGMINAIFMVNRLPGLDHKDFFKHWLEVHTTIASRLPGLRRYIVNPIVLEVLPRGGTTHDGWSEFWFDDLEAYKAALKSPQWAAMEADGDTMFVKEKGIVIGKEFVQKDENWKNRDWGALALSEDQIRHKLKLQGYDELAADPDGPAKVRRAAEKGRLAVWTPERIATWDESMIDMRPKSKGHAPMDPGDPAYYPVPEGGGHYSKPSPVWSTDIAPE